MGMPPPVEQLRQRDAEARGNADEGEPMRLLASSHHRMERRSGAIGHGGTTQTE
jgi:hypothetical protein